MCGRMIFPESILIPRKNIIFIQKINKAIIDNSAKVKKIGNVTVKNYLNESLLSLLCFIIYGQGSFEKGLM